MNTPPIGQTVLREISPGQWIPDWVRLARIDHGSDPQDAELGVALWGSDGSRYASGRDVWKEAPILPWEEYNRI